jgi:glutathione S-transferase
MPWTQSFAALMALGALILYLAMTMRVGYARVKYGIAAPAISGHPQFERAFRVQQNTLEQIPVFLGALYLCTAYSSALLAGIMGALWIAGRVLYMQAYLAAPEKRGPGFLISAAASAVLVIAALVGIARSFFIS